MEIAYYIDEGSNKNLLCRISDQLESLSFSLGYTINPTRWSSKNEECEYEDPYNHVLLLLKIYLDKRYLELKRLQISVTAILSIIKSELDVVVEESGIEGIARKLFDDANQPYGIPSYDRFVQAFAQFSALNRVDFRVKALTSVVQFCTGSGTLWEIDTCAGLTARLTDIVDNRLYTELSTNTKKEFWSSIYSCNAIAKQVFIPKLLVEWDKYWNEEYAEMQQKLGMTDHLDEVKQSSWRCFQVFMDCYEIGRDIVDLAYEISEEDLYPLVVITMLTIIDANECFRTYCELEFVLERGWSKLRLGRTFDDGDKTSMKLPLHPDQFFIKKSE